MWGRTKFKNRARPTTAGRSARKRRRVRNKKRNTCGDRLPSVGLCARVIYRDVFSTARQVRTLLGRRTFFFVRLSSTAGSMKFDFFFFSSEPDRLSDLPVSISLFELARVTGMSNAPDFLSDNVHGARRQRTHEYLRRRISRRNRIWHCRTNARV